MPKVATWAAANSMASGRPSSLRTIAVIAASSTCSQLSSSTTRSMKRARRNGVRAEPPLPVGPSAVTTASGTAEASATAASSTTRTPPLWAGPRRRMSSRGQRGLADTAGSDPRDQALAVDDLSQGGPILVAAHHLVADRRDCWPDRRRGRGIKRVALGLPQSFGRLEPDG